MMTCLPRRFYRASLNIATMAEAHSLSKGADDPRGAAPATAPFDRFAKAYWMTRDRRLKTAVDVFVRKELASGEYRRALDAAP